MSDFLKTFEELSKKQEQLKAEFSENRKQAISHIQEIVDQFGIKSSEIRFTSEGSAQSETRRSTTRMKYELPSGVQWSGKGHMKREFREYLDAHGLTKDDLDQFLIK